MLARRAKRPKLGQRLKIRATKIMENDILVCTYPKHDLYSGLQEQSANGFTPWSRTPGSRFAAKRVLRPFPPKRI